MKKLILCCLILGIVGCGKSQEELRLEKEAQAKALQEEKERELEQKRIEQENIIKASIKEDLIDPVSAIFTFKKGKSEKVYCGTVNSKNSFGGYVGAKRFIATMYANDITNYSIDEYSPLDNDYSQLRHLTKFEHRWIPQCEDIQIKKDIDVEDCRIYSESALHAARARLSSIEHNIPFSEIEKMTLNVYKDRKYIDVFLNDVKVFNLSYNDKSFPMMYAIANYKDCLEGKKL